jgi:hypothetical protein
VPSGGSSSNPSAGGSTPAKLLPSGGSAPESGATTGGASLGDVARPAKPSGRIVDTVSAVGTKHPTSVAPVATAAAP